MFSWRRRFLWESISSKACRRENIIMILLVIDIQKGITDERLYAFDGFVGNVQKLIGVARRLIGITMNSYGPTALWTVLTWRKPLRS